MVVLLAGLLEKPKLETSVLSIRFVALFSSWIEAPLFLAEIVNETLASFAALTHVGWSIWYLLALVVPSGNFFQTSANFPVTSSLTPQFLIPDHPIMSGRVKPRTAFCVPKNCYFGLKIAVFFGPGQTSDSFLCAQNPLFWAKIAGFFGRANL